MDKRSSGSPGPSTRQREDRIDTDTESTSSSESSDSDDECSAEESRPVVFREADRMNDESSSPGKSAAKQSIRDRVL